MDVKMMMMIREHTYFKNPNPLKIFKDKSCDLNYSHYEKKYIQKHKTIELLVKRGLELMFILK